MTTYGLLIKQTNELCRINFSQTNDEGIYLTDESDCQIFQVETIAELKNILIDNTSLSNSSRSMPNYGKFTFEDLQPVKIKLETQKIDVALPINIAQHDIKAILSVDLQKDYVLSYLKPKLVKNERFVGVYCNASNLKKCKNIFDFEEKFINKKVNFGRRQVRLCYSVVQTPESHKRNNYSSIKDSNVLFICGPIIFDLL